MDVRFLTSCWLTKNKWTTRLLSSDKWLESASSITAWSITMYGDSSIMWCPTSTILDHYYRLTDHTLLTALSGSSSRPCSRQSRSAMPTRANLTKKYFLNTISRKCQRTRSAKVELDSSAFSSPSWNNAVKTVGRFFHRLIVRRGFW